MLTSFFDQLILAMGVLPTLVFFLLGATTFLSGVMTGVLASEVQAVCCWIILKADSYSRACVSLNLRFVRTGIGSVCAEIFLVALVICKEAFF